MTQSIRHLERLVAFPTVSRDSNLELIDYAKRIFDSSGADCRIVGSEDGRKANLYAVIGPADRPGVLLSGHTDVVPCEGQAWSSDPFELRTSRGRLFGRGTSDMKGFLACCLALAETAANVKLETPLSFAFSYDEEVGCIGVRRLIDVMADAVTKPRFVIIGEPTSMQVATAHKGKCALRASCTGLEAHSSLAPLGVNAIHLACDLVAEIRAIQAEIAELGERDGDYDVPYTTLHVGRMTGGETLNIVPNACSLEFEIRHLPADDPQHFVNRIQRAADRIVGDARNRFKGASIDIETLNAYPALDTPPDAEVVSFVKSLTGTNTTGKLSFGTEGGLFQSRLGLSVVVCGPGSISVAHKPDEFIDESQMAACDRFLGKLLERLAAR